VAGRPWVHTPECTPWALPKGSGCTPVPLLLGACWGLAHVHWVPQWHQKPWGPHVPHRAGGWPLPTTTYVCGAVCAGPEGLLPTAATVVGAAVACLCRTPQPEVPRLSRLTWALLAYLALQCWFLV
jgi:hypothetical protein